MSILNSGKPLPKGQMKCNHCRQNCQTKNGDWFLTKESTDQQIFLCKACEAATKGAYKRASLAKL